MHSTHPIINTAPSAPQADADFDSFGLAAMLRQAVRDARYEAPTPIQRQAIPLILQGADLIGCAQTGTGKTAAFALPILHKLLEGTAQRGNAPVRVLVLAPTRELAAQIGDSFNAFARHTRLRAVVVFGGVGKAPQVRALAKRPAVLVATPGRLLDLLSDKALSLANVEVAVLDEADRMLDMGFIHDVRRIMSALPARRQTLLFSATISREIERMAAQFLDRPQRVTAAPTASTQPPIAQTVHFVEKSDKTALLINTLQNDLQALVFTRTKHGANKVVRQLAGAGIAAAAIHGDKSQAARQAALASFKNGRTRIVVATDLASRGLDIKELPLVVNYDLPNEAEVYVHRIGRTGRAGATGTAVSFCSRDELPYLGSIERLTQRRIDRVGATPAAETAARCAEPPRPRRHNEAAWHSRRRDTGATSPIAPYGRRPRRRGRDLEHPLRDGEGGSRSHLGRGRR